MKISGKRILVVAVALGTAVLLANGCSIPVYPGVHEESAGSEVLDRVDSVITDFMRSNHIPGLSLAVVSPDSLLVLRAYGKADREHDIPATPSTVFRAYSIAKVFTAMEIMKLAQEGHFSIDDPVAEVLPDWPDYHEIPGTGPLTIRHLLMHSGGLPRNSAFRQSEVPLADALRLHVESLAGSDAAYPAGTKYHYSNIGYNILGRIIENERRHNFIFIMNESVLPAYHMDNSTYYLGALTDATPVATGYTYKNWQYSAVQPYDIDLLASGNLFTTAEDLGACMQMFLGMAGNDSPRKSLLDTFVPQDSTSLPFTPMGLGWMYSNRFLGEPMLYHQGGDYDASAIVVLMPGSGMGISILTNIGSYESAALFSLVKNIFAITSGKKIPITRMHEAVAGSFPEVVMAEQAAGRYTGYGRMLEITGKGDALTMKYGPFDFRLKPEAVSGSHAIYSVHHWLGSLMGNFLPLDLDHMKVLFPLSNDEQPNYFTLAVSDLSFENFYRYPEVMEIPDSWKTIAGDYDHCTVEIKNRSLFMDPVGYLTNTGPNTFRVQGGIYDGEKVTNDPDSGALHHQGQEYIPQ